MQSLSAVFHCLSLLALAFGSAACQRRYHKRDTHGSGSLPIRQAQDVLEFRQVIRTERRRFPPAPWNNEFKAVAAGGKMIEQSALLVTCSAG